MPDGATPCRIDRSTAEPSPKMSLPFDPQVPRTLRLPEVRERRRALLSASHVKPLNEFAERLRLGRPGSTVPFFDPLDGGTAARILFLFEKPGPKTDADSPRGTGFVSRDNDGRTAEWTFRLMRLPHTALADRHLERGAVVGQEENRVAGRASRGSGARPGTGHAPPAPRYGGIRGGEHDHCGGAAERSATANLPIVSPLAEGEGRLGRKVACHPG